MAALSFNVTIKNETSQPRQVAEAVIYNAPGVTGANGNWEFDSAPKTFTLVSENGVVGTSGALRIKRAGVNEVGYIVAFGYWSSNNTKWIGVAGGLPPALPASAATVLPQFYGGGDFNVQGQYWTQDNFFQIIDPAIPETISITVNAAGGVLNTQVTIS